MVLKILEPECFGLKVTLPHTNFFTMDKLSNSGLGLLCSKESNIHLVELWELNELVFVQHLEESSQ